MENDSLVRPNGKFPEKVELLRRYSRFPGWNVPNGFLCSITTILGISYQLQVHGKKFVMVIWGKKGLHHSGSVCNLFFQY